MNDVVPEEEEEEEEDEEDDDDDEEEELGAKAVFLKAAAAGGALCTTGSAGAGAAPKVKAPLEAGAAKARCRSNSAFFLRASSISCAALLRRGTMAGAVLVGLTADALNDLRRAAVGSTVVAVVAAEGTAARASAGAGAGVGAAVAVAWASSGTATGAVAASTDDLRALLSRALLSREIFSVEFQAGFVTFMDAVIDLGCLPCLPAFTAGLSDGASSQHAASQSIVSGSSDS